MNTIDKQLKNRVKGFLADTPVGRHFYSFAKTYLTVFLALYIKGITEIDGDLILLNTAVISLSAKWAMIAVLRNAYKIITE